MQPIFILALCLITIASCQSNQQQPAAATTATPAAASDKAAPTVITSQPQPATAPATTSSTRQPAATSQPKAAPAAKSQPATVGFANEIDYICGMKVMPDYTDTCHYQGKVYGFCSEYCKDKFVANPKEYLK